MFAENASEFADSSDNNNHNSNNRYLKNCMLS
jgi:hypothetical protein